MSEDPISKSRIGPRGGGRPIPKSQRPESIDVNEDYASSFKGLRSRIIYIVCCFIPYIAVCVLIYLEGLESLGIALLSVPLALLLMFWLLQRKPG